MFKNVPTASKSELPAAFNPFVSKSLDISQERNYTKGTVEKGRKSSSCLLNFTFYN